MGQNFSRVNASFLRVDDAATMLAGSGKAATTRPNDATSVALNGAHRKLLLRTS